MRVLYKEIDNPRLSACIDQSNIIDHIQYAFREDMSVYYTLTESIN